MCMCIAVYLLIIGTAFALPKIHIANIGGGKPAEPNQYPWMLSLRKSGEHDCGAFLIPVGDNSTHSHIVLTAAHCVYSKGLGHYMNACVRNRSATRPELEGEQMHQNISRFTIVAGSHAINEPNVKDGVVLRSINRIEIYPTIGENCSNAHDIAVMKLNEPIAFTPKIQPIRLPSHGQTLEDGQNCTTAGWGYITSSIGVSGKITPDVLHHINLTIVPSQRCIELFAEAEKLTGNKLQRVAAPRFMYCANPGRNLPSTCNADSGGPLFCKDHDEWIAHGIVSSAFPICYGHGDDHWASPGLFTKIEPYLDWIDEKIRNWSVLVG